MGKKIYIHIGFRKTASTTIQVSLSRNYSLLLEHGILYPKSGRKYAHHDIAHLITENSRTRPNKESLNWLAEEIAQSDLDTVVLSSEVFSEAEVDQIQKLKAALPKDIETFVIAIVRRQDIWLQSMWTQFFKKGQVSVPFEVFMEGVVNQVAYPEEPLMDYLIYRSNPDFYFWIQKWAELFGEESIILRVLEKGQVKAEIFEEFLNIIGVEDTSQFQVIKKNIAPSSKTLEVIRFYVTRLGRKELPNFLPMTNFLADSIRDYGEKHGWNTEKYNSLTQETYTYLMKVYAESNAILAKTFLKREELFLLPFEEKPVTQFDLEELRSEEILSLATHIFKRFEEDLIFTSALIEYHLENQQKIECIEEQKKHVEQLSARNQNIKNKLLEIYASTSWKLIRLLQKVYGPVYRLLTQKSDG